MKANIRVCTHSKSQKKKKKVSVWRNQQMHSDTVTYICTDDENFEHIYTHKHTPWLPPVPPPLQIKQLIKPSSNASICSSTSSLLFCYKTPKYMKKKKKDTLKSCIHEDCPAISRLSAHAQQKICVRQTHMYTHIHIHRLQHERIKTHSPWSPQDQWQDGLDLVLLSLVSFPFLFSAPSVSLQTSSVSPQQEGEKKKKKHLASSWISAASPASLPPCLSSPSPLLQWSPPATPHHHNLHGEAHLPSPPLPSLIDAQCVH